MESHLRVLLRLKAAKVASVAQFFGMGTRATPLPGTLQCSFVFDGEFPVSGWRLIPVLAAETSAARRAGHYLRLVLAHEDVAKAGLALIPELEGVTYRDGALGEVRLEVKARRWFPRHETDRRAIAVLTRNEAPEVVVEGKVRYTNLNDLACMLLALEFCSLTRCRRHHYSRIRNALCRFDLDYVALVGQNHHYDARFSPEACRARQAAFARTNSLYGFLADYAAKGPLPNETFAELREGLKEFSLRDATRDGARSRWWCVRRAKKRSD